jgi:hypothetical protein
MSENWFSRFVIREGLAGFQVALKRVIYGLDSVCRVDGLADFRKTALGNPVSPSTAL